MLSNNDILIIRTKFIFSIQGMEQSQIETIDTVCQNLQMIASLIQNHVRRCCI